MRTRIFLLSLLLPTMVAAQWCSAAESGGEPGAFLRRGIGGRALAMGKAYTSISNDASSVYWNAAGLSRMDKAELQAMYSVLAFDKQQLFAGVGGKIFGAFALGAGWYRFGVGNIDGRDKAGNPTQKFDDSESSFMASASMKAGAVSFGLTGKYLQHALANNSATGFGLDVGAQLDLFEMFSIGLVLQDIGGQLTWDTDSNLKESIPLMTRGGVAFCPDFIPIVVSTELVKTGNGDMGFRVGGEYRVVEYFGVRAGFDDENATFGGMVKAPLESFGVQFDYAATHDVLENAFVHHVAFSILF